MLIIIDHLVARPDFLLHKRDLPLQCYDLFNVCNENLGIGSGNEITHKYNYSA